MSKIRWSDDSDRGTAADRRTGQAYGRLARGPACVGAALRDHRAAALPGGHAPVLRARRGAGFTRCRPTWPMVCLLRRRRGQRWPERPPEAAGPSQKRRTARQPRSSTRPPGRSGARWHGSTASSLSKRSTDSSLPSPSRRSPPRCCCPTSRMSAPAGNAERRRSPRNLSRPTSCAPAYWPHHGFGPARGARAVLACPPREQHDIALLILAVALERRGWRVVLLGANTPVASIVQAAELLDADCVVVSSTMPGELSGIADELKGLASSRLLLLAGPAGQRPADAADRGHRSGRRPDRRCGGA